MRISLLLSVYINRVKTVLIFRDNLPYQRFRPIPILKGQACKIVNFTDRYIDRTYCMTSKSVVGGARRINFRGINISRFA